MLNIQEFLQKYIEKNEKIILACSTWPDSMFLLYKILETDYKNNLVICYFNHQTRKETKDEESFILELSKNKWLKSETISYDFKKTKKTIKTKSFEELAREKRYIFLEKIRKKYKARYIITAHHLDDKIETFFFNLARWTKLSWLVNMTKKSGNILRPLLNLEKSEILDYLEKNKLKYFVDSSNLDINITRNYLRHKIIPKFSNLNKNYKLNLSNLLNYFEDIKSHIDKEVKKFLQENFLKNEVFDFGTSKKFFLIDKFNKKDIFFQKEIIRYIYFISNGKSTIGLSEANIDEMIRFINWKNNKTIKEIKLLKMKKDWNKIYF